MEGHPAEVVLLAIYAAVYPSLLAAVVILLSQPRRLQLLATYLAGGLTISIGLGLAILAAVKASGAVHGSRSGLSWGIDLGLGGLALLVAVALATRADERVRERRRGTRASELDDERQPWIQRLLARGSVPIVFVASLAINIPGVAYLLVLKDIAAAGHRVGVDIVLVVAFNLIMFLLAEIPLLGLVRAPERTTRSVARMDRWLSANGRLLAIVMCAGFGTFLIVRGIANS